MSTDRAGVHEWRPPAPRRGATGAQAAPAAIKPPSGRPRCALKAAGCPCRHRGECPAVVGRGDGTLLGPARGRPPGQAGRLRVCHAGAPAGAALTASYRAGPDCRPVGKETGCRSRRVPGMQPPCSVVAPKGFWAVCPSRFKNSKFFSGIEAQNDHCFGHFSQRIPWYSVHPATRPQG